MPNLEWRESSRRKPAPKNRRCSIEGCSRPHVARGWCHRHYERWSRNGDPHIGADLDDGPVVGIAPNPCRGCGGPKPKGRGRALCDSCVAKNRHVRLAANHERQRDRWLLGKYGISAERYDEILTEQGGGCAICGGGPSKSFLYLDVDHDHETGMVRGLLCRRCNTGLGYFERGFHELAIDYLKGVG